MNNGHFLQGSDNSSVFHSSGYARVARGNTIGSMNTQSFGQRAYLEQNRTAVRRYGESMVGQSYLDRGMRNPEPQSPGMSHEPGYRPQPRGTLSRPAGRIGASPQMPQRTFREPPPRYNPYA